MVQQPSNGKVLMFKSKDESSNAKVFALKNLMKLSGSNSSYIAMQKDDLGGERQQSAKLGECKQLTRI